MNHLEDLLRAALPPTGEDPPRDVWRRLEARLDAPPSLSWVDIGLAAAALLALWLNPEWIEVLAYHL